MDTEATVRPGAVGIFAHGPFADEKMDPVRLRALLAEAALQEVDLHFIAGDACDPAGGTVAARRWRRGAWQTAREAPPPVVAILNRPFTAQEKAVDAWLRQATLCLGFWDETKLAVAGMLDDTPWARHVIPTERLVADRLDAQLAAWLAGGGIAVKPDNGMRGRGVHFAIPAGADRWEVISDDRLARESSAAAVARIARAIRGRLGYRDYVVQRYIDTRDGSGRPGTIRVDIARRPDGGWGVFRTTGRIAAPGKIVSTISRGASLANIEPFLAARGARDVPALLAEAEAISLGIAGVLTARGASHSYEWAMDLVLGPDQGLWFLEANARPLAFGGELERARHVIAYFKALVAA